MTDEYVEVPADSWEDREIRRLHKELREAVRILRDFANLQPGEWNAARSRFLAQHATEYT
jgi:hypothetical protein